MGNYVLEHCSCVLQDRNDQCEMTAPSEQEGKKKKKKKDTEMDDLKREVDIVSVGQAFCK